MLIRVAVIATSTLVTAAPLGKVAGVVRAGFGPDGVSVRGGVLWVANADGTWCAYESVCPHQATPLGGVPLLRRTLLQCPEHGSVFDVTTGQCVLASNDGWSGPLRTYPTRVVGDAVQVSLRG